LSQPNNWLFRVKSCLRPCWLHPAVSQIVTHLLQRTNQAGRATTNKALMLSASLMVSRLGGRGRSSAAQQHQKAGRRVRNLYYLAYKGPWLDWVICGESTLRTRVRFASDRYHCYGATMGSHCNRHGRPCRL